MVRRADHDSDPDTDTDTATPAGFDPEGSTLPPEPRPDAPGGPADRDERLGEAIEAYLEQAEGGVPPDPESFAAAYPDLNDDLLAALEGLALVKGLVGGPGGPGHRLEEGRRVAGYRIVRELGRGGMGVVYEAVHVGLDRPVALKVLGSQAAPDSSGRRRFLNEARTAAGLHHTHIVPVFDVGQVGGLCYYAMQRIEGSGLDRVLRVLRRDRSVASGSTQGSTLKPGKPGTTPPAAANGAPPRSILGGSPPSASALGDETLSWAGDLGAGGSRGPGWRLDGDGDGDAGPVFAPPRGSSYYRWVADVGQQAAEALAHAHQRGIIHRDIKPSNLLVDTRGVIWVADFGLARRLADPSQTQVDSLLGTPRYMSPEQAKTGAIDGRADVYSLGATLYELITLRPPFDGQTAAELIEQIAGREPARPRKFDPRVPLDLETILLKALAKRPADRYAGATELADDLGRFLAHEPVKARRIGPVGRTWRFARRHPGASAVSALALSLVLTTATVAYVRIVRERDRADLAAIAAHRARAGTEAANAELNNVVAQLKAEVLKGYENQATNVLLSTAPKRRSVGLELVRRAADLGRQMRSNPALRVRLRDQALAFLTLRDVESRPPIALADGPRRGLILGPNGRRVGALTAAGELSVWDVESRKLIDESSQPIAPRRVAGGPGNRNGMGGGGGGNRPPVSEEWVAMAGDQFLVAQPDGAGVRWFELARPDEPIESYPLKGQQVMTVLATRDGRRFVTVGRVLSANPGSADRPDPRGEPEEFRLSLWDRDHPESPRITFPLPAPRADNPFTRYATMLVAFAPDGSRIAAVRVGEADSKISLWDGDGQPLDPIRTRYATALALGPAGLLAVASGGDVALWDLSGSPPKPLPDLDLHQSMVTLLRFGPRDGSLLAAAGRGGGIELWDLATHTPIATLPTSEGVEDLAFAPDGRTLAATHASTGTASEGRTTGAAPASLVSFWSLVEPTAQYVLPESSDLPTALAFGPGDILAIASREAPLRLWGGPGQCPPSITSWPRHRPTSVSFDASGRMITPEPDAIRWFQPPNVAPVAEVALPTDGRTPRLGARTLDGTTLLLQRGNGPPLWRWQASQPGELTRIDPTERIEGFGMGYGRGPTLALAADARRLYHLARRGEELAARTLDSRGLHAALWSVGVSQAVVLALSPDGQTLAVGTHSGEVELRNAADGSLRGRLPTADDDDPVAVESLAFAPDGRTLAVGGREQVRLWTVDASALPLVRLTGHRGSVRALAFDSRGVRLAGADEKTIKVWDLAKLRAEFSHLGLDW